MSPSEFAFVPRKLAKLKESSSTSNKYRPTSSRITSQPLTAENDNNTTTERRPKGKENVTLLEESTYVSLLEIALSEYSIWSSSVLSKHLETDEDGYVPLSYITRTSSMFCSLKAGQVPTESFLLKCIKSSSLLECRMIVSSVYNGSWTEMSDDIQGGYEIRRKDWELVKSRLHKYTSFHWSHRTIYVENIPHNTWSIPSIAQLIQEILPLGQRKMSCTPVQGISFPPHRDDSPSASAPIKCKGFAFVVLDQASQIDALLASWPWNRLGGDDLSSNHIPKTKFADDALESGLRCLSMRQWEKLRSEYQTLQQSLLKKTLALNEQVRIPILPSTSTKSSVLPSSRNDDTITSRKSMPEKSVMPSTSPAVHKTSYPLNCLVIIKNIHPETNKTTLRTLFSKAINKDLTVIDYVDYNKGLDSCYLRLASPDIPPLLVAYFGDHSLIHAHALDDEGTTSKNDTDDVIKVELIQGTREAIYWEKVPEKVKNAALAKIKGGQSSLPVPHIRESKNNDSDNERKRKRRRHY